MINVGIVRFPGSNCDYDTRRFFDLLGCRTGFVWCEALQDLYNYDLIVLPGGFSFGDYEGVGVTASRTPVVQELGSFVSSGGKVLGICNGFQILTVAGLLPGYFAKNKCETYFSAPVEIETDCYEFGRFTGEIPIANKYGNYRISGEGLAELRENSQIIMRYSGENPTGSVGNIAGICDENRNIFGIMPHPERVAGLFFENNNGIIILRHFLKNAFYEKI